MKKVKLAKKSKAKKKAVADTLKPDPLADYDAAPDGGYKAKEIVDGGYEYDFTEKERASLLKRMQKESRDAWQEQLEYRRRCLKLEDYVAGRQVYDISSGRYVGHEIASAPSPDNNVDEELFIFNFIGRIHLSNVQRLSAYDIAPMVVPNSSSPDDKMGARIGKVALSDMLDKVGEESLKRRIAVIISKYGTVFLKTSYDPSLGKLVHPVSTRTVLDEEGNERQESYIDTTIAEPEGQVILEAISPRNMLAPRYCPSGKEADWLEQVTVVTTDWIWRNYAVKVEPEPQNSTTWVSPQAVDMDQRDVEWQWGMPLNGAVLRRRYVRPCPDFQRGAIIDYTEKHILRATDLLSYYNDLPFDVAVMSEDEKSIFGVTPLWDIIPIQDGLNADLTAIVNHGKMYGDLQVWAPVTSQIKLDKISSATGAINLYQGESGPSYLKPPDLSETHFTTLNVLQQLGQSLGAAQDISRSNKALSGNALATLQQMDNSVLRPALKSIGEMLENACKKALSMMGDYYTVERVVKMTGRSGYEIIDNFTGANLNGNYDVRISLMTGLSDNPIVRQETVLKALTAKVIGVQEARQYLEMGESDQMLEDIQKENEVAEKAVRMLADPTLYITQGKLPITLHDWDNHAMMVRRLLAYMRENYDEAEPEVQEGLSYSLQFHQAKLLPPAPVPGAPGAMPEGGSPMPPGPVPGPMPGAGLLDSVQNPIDQPPQDAVESPQTGPDIEPTPGA